MNLTEPDKFLPHTITPLVVDERTSNGQAKPVIQGTWKRLHTSIVHIPPLGVTAVLVWMNHARIFWFPATGPTRLPLSTDTVMNMLQLAAKLHEIIIIASLADMTLKIFKRKLVGSGLPLGLLTGGYRVGDLTYLVNSPFLWNISCLGALLALTTIVATIAGPASAILMLPGLDWYPLPGALDKIITPMVYNRFANQTWPTVVNASIFNYTGGEYCAEWLHSVYSSDCPAAGSAEISNWIAGWRESALSEDLTFQEPKASIRRQLLLETSPSGVTYASTISTATMLSIGRLLNYIKSTDVGTIHNTAQFRLSTVGTASIYQPLVQTKCSVWSRGDLMHDQEQGWGSQAFYDPESINCFGDDTCQRMIKAMEDKVVPESSWNQSDYSPSFSYHLMGPKQDEEAPLLLVLHVPYANQTDVGTWIVGCTFMAHWVPTTVTISPFDSDMVGSNITSLSVFYNSSSDVSAGPAVKLEDSWVLYLNPTENITTTLPNGTNITESRSLIGSLLSPIITSDSTKYNNTGFFNPGSTDTPDSLEVKQFFQKTFGAIVAEGLSRTASNASTYVVLHRSQTRVVMADIAQQWGYGVSNIIIDWTSGPVTTSWRNLSETHNDVRPEDILAELDALVKYDFEVMRYGYGSGVPGATLSFGLAVMYIYFAMVGIYGIMALCMRARTVVAWNDLQDLLVLAWASRAPVLLRGLGAGVDKKGAWLMNTKIKADSMGRAQLVGDDAEDMIELVKNARYH